MGSCKSLSKTMSYLARSCTIARRLPLLSFESSLLDPRKGKLHFANINVAFTSLSKTFFQKFVFPAETRATLLLLSLYFSIAHIWHTLLHDVCSFEFAAINAPSNLNLLYPKGFKMHRKSLERHFHKKITSRTGSKRGPCLMNNITDTFVVLELIVLQNSTVIIC